MMLEKLKNIKKRIFKTKIVEKQRVIKDPLDEALLSDLTHPGVDKSSLAGIAFLRERLNAKEKKYFDSADHFMKINNIENIEKNIIKPIESNTDNINTENTIENLKASITSISRAEIKKDEVNTAPLESAYTDVVDEMKPKESI